MKITINNTLGENALKEYIRLTKSKYIVYKDHKPLNEEITNKDENRL